jgi:hypothetical protein
MEARDRAHFHRYLTYKEAQCNLPLILDDAQTLNEGVSMI